MRRVFVAGRSGVTLDDRGQVSGQRCMAARQVGRIVMRQRPNDGQTIGPLRQLSEVLTDLGPGDGGRDGAKLASNLSGCVGLEIKRVQLTRAPPHEQKNAGFGSRRPRHPHGCSARGFCSNPQPESQSGKGTSMQNLPPIRMEQASKPMAVQRRIHSVGRQSRLGRGGAAGRNPS